MGIHPSGPDYPYTILATPLSSLLFSSLVECLARRMPIKRTKTSTHTDKHSWKTRQTVVEEHTDEEISKN